MIFLSLTEPSHIAAQVFRYVLLSLQPEEHPANRHEQHSSVKYQNAPEV